MSENNGQHCLINMRDGRIIPYTNQAIKMVDYHAISHEVAMAIKDGRVTRDEVISRIKANLINNQDAWEDLLKRKTTMNVHRSTLNKDDSEGLGTTPSAEEASGEFQMEVPAGDAPAPKNKGGKKDKGAKKGGENYAAGEGAPAEAGAGEAPAAEDAGAGAGEPLKI